MEAKDQYPRFGNRPRIMALDHVDTRSRELGLVGCLSGLTR